jgi:hypothetical protein
LYTENADGLDVNKLPSEYHSNPRQYLLQQHQQQLQTSSSSHSPPSSYHYDPSFITNLESEWKKELSRYKGIQEKVDKLFSIADLNKDGQLNYTEFLFAMAEGLADRDDFINTDNSEDVVKEKEKSKGAAATSTGSEVIAGGKGNKRDSFVQRYLNPIKIMSALPSSSRRQVKQHILYFAFCVLSFTFFHFSFFLRLRAVH